MDYKLAYETLYNAIVEQASTLLEHGLDGPQAASYVENMETYARPTVDHLLEQALIVDKLLQHAIVAQQKRLDEHNKIRDSVFKRLMESPTKTKPAISMDPVNHLNPRLGRNGGL